MTLTLPQSLTDEQKRQFRTQGYLHMPGAVPRERVDAALRAINHSIGQGVSKSELAQFRAGSFCPELRSAAAIMDLYNHTPLRDLAESAVGRGRLAKVAGAQIALKFPELRDPADTSPMPKPPPHLDGMYYPGNGVPKGQIYNFTALAGVMLSDVPGEYCANFTVWPGSHARNAAYFRAHGPQALLDGMPKVEMGEPVQITGRAGDVVLAHYLLTHSVTCNLSPHVRYAIYFRLTHIDHARQRWESMADEWLQWEGMRRET
jgi:hypothetical protein